MPDTKPYRLLAYMDGRLIEDTGYDNWAQIGGKIGNLVGDVDVIQVRKGSNLVLLYNVNGVY